MDISWIYKFYLLPVCKQFLRNMLTILSSLLNGQEKAQFRTELGLQSDVEEACHLTNGEKKYTLSFKYRLNGRYYISVAAFPFQTYIRGCNVLEYSYYVIYSKKEKDLFSRIANGNGPDIIVDSDDESIYMHGEAQSWIYYVLFHWKYHSIRAQLRNRLRASTAYNEKLLFYGYVFTRR